MNFKFDEYLRVSIDQINLKVLINKYNKDKFKGLTIYPGVNNNYINIDSIKNIIKNFNIIEGLILDNIIIDDLMNLRYFKFLNSLTLYLEGASETKLDLLEFSQLVNLRTTSFINIDNFGKSIINLIVYSQGKMNYFQDDLILFDPPRSLLQASIGNINKLKSLNGIQKAINLKILTISLLRKLTDLSSLTKLNNLEEFNISHCSKIDYNNFPPISSLKSFHIRFDESGKIPHLNFLKDLPNLESLTFMGVIEDGDLSPIFELKKLKSLWFKDRRKYSHKWIDICKTMNIPKPQWMS